MMLLFSTWAAFPTSAACVINGTVYRDYNANGSQDIREPGVQNIIVRAYPTTGAFLQTTTDANGDYTFDLSGLADSEVRIEFSGLPNYLRPGPYGANGNSTTTVTFVNCNSGAGVPVVPAVNLAVNNPGQYCHPSPLIATTCFVEGNQLTGANQNDDVLISFAYSSGLVPPAVPHAPPPTAAAYGADPHDDDALASQIGTNWGMAYHRSSDTLILAPFLKRHTGLGPGGTGTLYLIRDLSNNLPGPETIQTFDLDALFGANFAGADPRPPAFTDDDYLTDTAAYDAVGKIGWGDMDLSEDDNTLFAINLNNQSLYKIPIGRPPTPGAGPVLPTTRTADMGPFRVPFPASCPSPATNIRPFALKYYDGIVYVGMVCSAETTQLRGDLRAYIYTFNPTTNAYSGAPILQFALDYTRRCLNDNNTTLPCVGRSTTSGFNPIGAGDWLPWRPDFPFGPGAGTSNVSYPQPMFVDIEFDNGDLILGFRDRFGDQQGDRSSRSPNFPVDATLYNVRPGGDILRACANGAGGWTVENNADCGGITTLGAGNANGPGNGEYYYGETFGESHDEIALGGLAQIPGAEDLTASVFDPVPINGEVFDAGVRWLRNVTFTGGINPGAVARAYRIYNTDAPPAPPYPRTFGKANGLGDMEATCGPEPLEIGNRVWEDLDRNGQQDPGEMPLAGVIVSLYDAADNLLATATTNAAGEYYFRGLRAGEVTGTLPAEVGEVTGFFDINGNGTREANEPTGVLPFTAYTVRLNDPGNFGGGPLTNYYATPNDTVAQMRDSDGTVIDFNSLVSATNFPRVSLTTGDFGENDHTFDFGFALQPPPVPPVPPVADQLPPGDGVAPNLIIVKAAQPPFAQPGDTVEWKITVTNPGAGPVNNIKITDRMPDELEILSASATAGMVVVNGQEVTFTLATLGPGEQVTITITTRIKSSVKVPFIITNSIDAFITDADGNILITMANVASADVISVSTLPRTGESPWWLPIAAILLICGAAFALYRMDSKSIQEP